MTRRDITMERYGWEVSLYMDYTAGDAAYLCQRLSGMGCGEEGVREAYRHLAEGGRDCGLTYSNIAARTSLVAIGTAGSTGSAVNTIGHELLHVVAHICEADGIDMKGEEACYMMGELCEKIFNSIK